MKKSLLAFFLIPTIAMARPSGPCTVEIISPSTTIAFSSNHCVEVPYCPHNRNCITDLTLNEAVSIITPSEHWKNLPLNANVTVVDAEGNTQVFSGHLRGDDLYLSDRIFADGFEEEFCD